MKSTCLTQQQLRAFNIFSANSDELRGYIEELSRRKIDMTDVMWSLNECNTLMMLASFQLSAIENEELARRATYIAVAGILLSLVMSALQLVAG